MLHNEAVRTAVDELEESMNHLDMRLTTFGPENWRDALSNVQTTAVRLHSDLDELKRALGYADPNGADPGS